MKTQPTDEALVMYSCRIPANLIAKARSVGDHMRGGTSAAIRKALALGLPKLERDFLSPRV